MNVTIGAFTTDIAFIVIAMIGGIARYLDQYVRTGVAPRWGLLAAHTVVSCFSGYMVAQAVLKMAPEWAFFSAGMGGYLGTQGLDWLSTILTEKFGGKIEKPDKVVNDDKPKGDT